MSENFNQLVNNVRQCTLCEDSLALGANPVIQISTNAKILIAGQAPGLKVHRSSIPFMDQSGDRLRAWLKVEQKTFYDPTLFAILPMGFCYPGRGKSGDLAPIGACAKQWREKLLAHLTQLELIIAIGSYAQNYHLGTRKKVNLTQTVKSWQSYTENTRLPILPLPHPSPRNNIWLKKNPWFEQDVLPYLQHKIKNIV
ncbi:uracil-DNA glycosylase, family 4 [Colwellia chukchiensis]|uniref:Uracil-DNA glycosylase, family 4 n=1 Tax=Colwellia chukchiensis TaxID=641665 RepID=A0A1H7SLW8_9GAMM|nr:uracil-DNA glycosylase family protein [Colwellia chukchiensis]SEL73495.1 uracil-DNA glycosylase, family 4 [Colwellia chukchiensis]